MQRRVETDESKPEATREALQTRFEIVSIKTQTLFVIRIIARRLPKPSGTSIVVGVA